MELAGFIAYALALGIAAIIPGPGITALVGRSLGAGFSRTMPMLCGLLLGDVVYLTFAILGLAIIAQNFSTLFLLIRILGAGYLLWIAWQFWQNGIQIGQDKVTSTGADLFSSFFAGFAVTMGNPKTVVFYMALLPGVIDLRTVSFSDYAVLSMLTIMVLLITLTPYIAVAARMRLLFTKPEALRWLGRGAAAAMAGAASFVLLKAP